MIGIFWDAHGLITITLFMHIYKCHNTCMDLFENWLISQNGNRIMGK